MFNMSMCVFLAFFDTDFVDTDSDALRQGRLLHRRNGAFFAARKENPRLRMDIEGEARGNKGRENSVPCSFAQ